MVKTLKAGDTVWRFDGKPKKYAVCDVKKGEIAPRRFRELENV